MNGPELQRRIPLSTCLDHVRIAAHDLDREAELVSSRRAALHVALRRARTAGATLGQLQQACGRSREYVRRLTKETTP